jgi:hypothetical protein
VSSREILAVLVVAGAVLPVAGIAWGAVVARPRVRELAVVIQVARGGDLGAVC